MILDLTNSDDFPRVFDLTLKPEVIDTDGEIAVLISNVNANATVDIENLVIIAGGMINAPVKLSCSRCLNEVETLLEIPFSARFADPGSQAGENDIEVSADELDLSVIENDQLDLIEIVREQILLALPAKFVCRVDCKGLCRICGGDKNLIDCKCDETGSDPRWSALKNLSF